MRFGLWFGDAESESVEISSSIDFWLFCVRWMFLLGGSFAMGTGTSEACTDVDGKATVPAGITILRKLES